MIATNQHLPQSTNNYILIKQLRTFTTFSLTNKKCITKIPVKLAIESAKYG